MALDINGEIYDIRWRHERDYYEQNDKDVIIKLGRTVAYIFDSEGETIEAYANCSIKDTYSKKLGRRIAVGRLLKKLGLDTKIALKI